MGGTTLSNHSIGCCAYITAMADVLGITWITLGHLGYMGWYTRRGVHHRVYVGTYGTPACGGLRYDDWCDNPP
eukprot:11307212-Ditylum_brightwellii.AAC.1